MEVTSPTKSVSVKQENSMLRGVSILSIAEDNMNTMLMRSMLQRLRQESTDTGTDKNGEPSCPRNGTTCPPTSPSSNTGPILFQRNVNDDLTTGTNSHGRSIIEKQRPPRKQPKSKSKMRVATTKILFKRKISKEPSWSLAKLRKVLLMEPLESDSDTTDSEDEENAALQRPVYDPAFLEFIDTCEDKENIDLEAFQAKLKLGD